MRPDFELAERASNGRTAVPPTRKVTMHVSASVQTGPQGLPASHVSAIRGRGVGLTPRGWAGGTPRAGSARLSHRLTPVVTSSIDRKIFILSCGSENGDSGVSALGCDEDHPCSERPSLYDRSVRRNGCRMTSSRRGRPRSTPGSARVGAEQK